MTDEHLDITSVDPSPPPAWPMSPERREFWAQRAHEAEEADRLAWVVARPDPLDELFRQRDEAIAAREVQRLRIQELEREVAALRARLRERGAG